MSKPPKPSAYRLKALRPFAAFGGMILFITLVDASTRISLKRTPNETSLTYRRHETFNSNPPPADRGIVIAPPETNKPNPVRRVKQAITGQRDDLHDGNGDADANVDVTVDRKATSWIFDTGAATHLCCNEKLMHSTVSFAHTPFKQTTVNFGPNPVPVRGIGEVTFDLPLPLSPALPRPRPPRSLLAPLAKQSQTQSFIPSTAAASTTNQLLVETTSPDGDGDHYRGHRTRLTISNVVYVPSAGVNLISWSQLKTAKGAKLALREGERGELEVWEERTGLRVMTFVLKGGLYWLVQGIEAKGEGGGDGG